MELTIEQALQQGVAAHKEGKLQDAERLYLAILQSQPMHPDANHNLGTIAVSVNKADAALPLFKTALEANPKIEQFWLSYIDALIKEKQFDNAKQVLEQAKKQGVDADRLNSFDAQLSPKTEKPNTARVSPPQELLNSLLGHYQNGRFSDAEKLSVEITQDFPRHQFAWKVLGAVLGATGRKSEAVDANQTAVALSPQDAEAHRNLGVTLKELGRLDEAEASYTQAIALKPDYAEAHSNLGNTLKELGRLEEAEASYTQAIALKPDYAEAHSNLGNTLKELGRLEEAEASYTQAIALKPDYAEAHSNLGGTLEELGRLDEAEASYTQAIALKPDLADAFWNLHGIQKTIQSAEHWIDKCLEADENYVNARLTKAALRFYQGDRNNFDELMQSKFKQHPYARSFSWAFSLTNLPQLHFNKFYFFDAVVKKSIISKPFYEFGVWRASSFKYLLKSFKKGYGFDTFTGLPEDWDVGSHVEKKGAYTSDGNVPNIKGGEFIVGKFEDTLPVFFSESRPIASVINFDADLYSSTLCALNFSKQVMDKDTILIFDELIIHESWEQDEFKALNEFCSINHYSYEVIAISFFTKQVAVKLIGI
ncbi:tetratricopeptide repeat protein [Gammaproteobacteria bacterium]|nr:tetratricopeptide repeat protein [Gammaproteobacteria bacterium]